MLQGIFLFLLPWFLVGVDAVEIATKLMEQACVCVGGGGGGLRACMRARARVCVRVCVCVCVVARVRARARARVCVCVPDFYMVHQCIFYEGSLPLIVACTTDHFLYRLRLIIR